MYKIVDAGYISHAGGDENLLIYFMWPRVHLCTARMGGFLRLNPLNKGLCWQIFLKHCGFG